jgi:cytochrome c peroxidase
MEVIIQRGFSGSPLILDSLRYENSAKETLSPSPGSVFFFRDLQWEKPRGGLFTDSQFHNNGLDVSPADPGRAMVTGRDDNIGNFSTPTLRNVALTAPYMHDGRFKTLEEVIEHYSSGVQRSPTLDPNLAKHPAEGIQLSSIDKKALVAFLKTLTDTNLPASFPPKPASN